MLTRPQTTRPIVTTARETTSEASAEQAPESVNDGKDTHEPVFSDSVRRSVSGYLEAMRGQPVTELYELVLSEMEAPLLECLMRHTGNNQSQTAEMLGLNRGTLRKKLKKYGLL